MSDYPCKMTICNIIVVDNLANGKRFLTIADDQRLGNTNNPPEL